MDLVIKQNNNQQENGNSALLDLLYNLTKLDPSTGQAIVDNAILVGRISVPAAYEDAVNFLNTRFSVEQDNGSDFQVTVLNNNYYIRFVDEEVVRVLLANNIGDGIGISVQVAATANLGLIFQNNTTIESFNELQYFSKVLSANAFNGCSSLKSVTLSNSQTILDRAVFKGTALTSINIPVGCTKISQNCFNSCSRLTQISIPSTLTRSEDYAFDHCDALARVDITDLDAWCGITFTKNNANPIFVAKKLYLNDTLVTTVDLTNITELKQYVFYNLESLTSIANFSGLTTIGGSVFTGCTNLVIPNLALPNLASLGNSAFRGTKVQTVSDLGFITSIPESCFNDCKQLTSITIPSSLTSIGNSAFQSCSSLVIQDLNLPNLASLGSNAFYGTKIQVISDLGHITELKWGTFQSCTALTTVTLPNGLTTIAGNAFYGCSSLSIVNLPSSVTTIGADGFGTGSITTVNITDLDAWTNIDFNQGGSSPIRGNTQLLLNGNPVTTYSFPNDRTTIKKLCFCAVKSLTSVTIPSSVISIGDSAFRGCSGLTSVTIPNSVTSIGDRAFRDCSGLTSISIPNSVTSISSGAFDGCAALTSITIPDNVTSDVNWFYGCDALTTVVLGSGITRIKALSFRNDLALRSLTVKAVNPPVCEDNALAQSAIVGYYGNYCDIYVPAGSVDAYKTADGWKDIPNADTRIKAIQT